MKNRKITGIMACDPQGVIGNKGQMLWSYTKEFEYFYQTVKNNIIVMGRKTFDSIPTKILKNCICIVFLVKNFYTPILFSLIINRHCPCVILMLSHNKIIKDYK